MSVWDKIKALFGCSGAAVDPEKTAKPAAKAVAKKAPAKEEAPKEKPTAETDAPSEEAGSSDTAE